MSIKTRRRLIHRLHTGSVNRELDDWAARRKDTRQSGTPPLETEQERLARHQLLLPATPKQILPHSSQTHWLWMERRAIQQRNECCSLCAFRCGNAMSATAINTHSTRSQLYVELNALWLNAFNVFKHRTKNKRTGMDGVTLLNPVVL